MQSFVRHKNIIRKPLIQQRAQDIGVLNKSSVYKEYIIDEKKSTAREEKQIEENYLKTDELQIKMNSILQKMGTFAD